MTDRERTDSLVHALDAIPHDVTMEDFNVAVDAIERALAAARAEGFAEGVEAAAMTWEVAAANWRAAHDAHCDVPQPCAAHGYDYSSHNVRGEDGPCGCWICRVHPYSIRALSAQGKR